MGSIPAAVTIVVARAEGEDMSVHEVCASVHG